MDSNSYCQPTVLWKLVRGASTARAVFVPHKHLSTLVIFRDAAIDKIEDVRDWDVALQDAHFARNALAAAGWTECD